ncbi:MAG: hypothetical protein UR63_C0004G0007 [Candidatus Roizmanbacteria bacterium GW2011_GWC2_35_12]|uniref:Uncharacterized protein n=1 Tax=Candidatus Roizmanbacteria bacterium GW2011_GWC2_35_12 TaxID=1618485 RepID=A0A0G0BFN0_9BACT|nr:MAG: hypothetical protein UR63_C0004G0007 [Candidatus Roizmanbacteria bacterium GW2011_GWC2_35_12]
MKKKLKIGFDLDGVILYNPIRFVRRIAKAFKFLKPVLLHQEKNPFYFPKTKLEIFLFTLLHKSSFKIDRSLPEINKLVKAKKIEAYIVTGRYSFLKKDFDNWIKIINKDKIFKDIYQNTKDLQPNEFKIKMIKKLNLDVYVEDNYDIIERLNNHTKAKIYWITNFLDKNIPYKFKFSSLKETVEFLRKHG